MARLALAGGVLFAALALQTEGDARAADHPAAAVVELTGTVAVTRNGDQITGISLRVGGDGEQAGTYSVVLDNKGRQLAAHDGRVVIVAGAARGFVLTVTRIGRQSNS